MRKLTTEQFIDKAVEVHNENYDYNLVNYEGSKIKVKIVCPEHGLFEQTPSHHLSGKGCKQCGYNKVAEGQSDSKNSFIDKAKSVHGSIYDYSKVDYKSSNKKVEIICTHHGSFYQTPNKHLLGQGCRKCGYNRLSGVPKKLLDAVKEFKTLVSGVYYRGNYTKYSKAYDVLGCSWDEFVEYLENNEFGFKVGQEGIDLDHIVPISEAKSEDDIVRLSHFTNFQLLPSYYNRYEKKANKFDIDHFRNWWETQRGKTTV